MEMCLNKHSQVRKTQCLIGVYLLEVDNLKCSGDIEVLLHPSFDYGIAIIEMFGPDPLYLLYHSDFNKHNLKMIKTQFNASH